MSRRDESRSQDEFSGDEYLWDKTGPVDEDVASLERLLAPFRLDPANETSPDAAVPRIGAESAEPSEARDPGASVRGRLVRIAGGGVLLAAAAAVLVAVFGWPPDAAKPSVVTPTFELAVVDARGDPTRVLSTDSGWFDATADERNLRLARAVTDAAGQDVNTLVGEFEFAAGSRLRLDALSDELARFRLEIGTMHAFVVPDVPRRFFQVDTPSVRCVDLGCEYDLTVDADGLAHVVVTSGEVSFEDSGREVYVPQGAECRAVPGRGPGTPRFGDAPASLVAGLDAFDALSQSAIDERAAAARDLVRDATRDEDTLSLWHLLADPQVAVVAAAEAQLVEVVGPPAGAPRKGLPTYDIEDWRTYLEELWWR